MSLPLYAPVEVSTRDFLWKLFYFYETDIFTSLVIGHHPKVNKIATSVGGGAYIGKNTVKASLNDLTSRLSAALSQSKCFLVHHDEEGGLLTQHPSLRSSVWIVRHPLDLLPIDSCSVVWGQDAFDTLSAFYPDHRSKLLNLGALRFDLYHPRFIELLMTIGQKVNLAPRDYKLIFSNFSLATTHTMTSHIKSPDLPFISELTALKNLTLNSMSDYSAFYGLVDQLSAFSASSNLLLKPHPAENIYLYTLLSQFIPNLNLVSATLFNSVPVLLRSASDVVCSRCTTLVESILSGKPTSNIVTSVDAYSLLNASPVQFKSDKFYDLHYLGKLDIDSMFSLLRPLIANLDHLNSFTELNAYLAGLPLKPVSSITLHSVAKLLSFAKSTSSPKFIPFDLSCTHLLDVLNLLGLTLVCQSSDLLVISK